ncbi:MAG: homoserine dehydrogenase [Bacteroidota bacterium]
MTKQKLRIGLFGYGCVGSGLYDVLKRTPNFNAEIVKICVKDKHKPRNIPAHHFTFDKDELLNDESINVIVELIDNADDAFDIVTRALQQKKAVVTANKKLLAEHFTELYLLQQQHNTPLLYEASVGGAIPIIRTLEEYYDNDTLSSIEGILNGTTNFILTKTASEGKGYTEVLQEAQALGFAESDPTLDVQAFDPKYKLTILLAHAFGLIVKPEEILNYGIHHLTERDVQYANEKGYKLKLVAQASKEGSKIKAFIIPKFVQSEDAFYTVNNEFNAIQIEAAFSDKQLLKGKGAGSYPTAAAVLSDISALSYDYRYGYRKIEQHNLVSLNNDVLLNIYLRYTDNDIFDVLNFETVEEEFVSREYKYIIGKISLQQLLNADLNNRNDIFIAEAPEPIVIPSLVKAAEAILENSL